MEVTITLGEKAMEFVTGIPDEELPDILSDVLERSLREQVDVKQLENATSQKEDGQAILKQLKDLLATAGYIKTTGESVREEDSTFATKRDVAVEVVESSPPIDLGNTLSMLQGLFK